MKKGEAIIIVFLIFFLATNLSNTNAKITGESITGEATQSVGFNITVVAAELNLTIKKPENQTYFNNESLKVKIESNANTIWYNLDYGANITLIENSNVFISLFNTTAGGHSLYAFGNDSSGNNIGKNVNFTINLGLFNVSYETFQSGNKNSTDFNRYSYDEIQNMTNIFFEDFSYGKIEFLEGINLTDDDDHTDSIINITPYINISSNYIFINATALKNFNKSATLLLSGLTFTTPRILIDSVVCPSTICTKNYYSNNNLSFNVTHFSAFSAEETSEDSSESSTGSSGGSESGGSTKAKQIDIILEPNSLTFNLINKERGTREITITNKEDRRIKIETEVISLKDIIIIPSTIILEAGESKSITVKVKSAEKGLLTGRILFKVEKNTIKELPVTINVRTENFLLDAKIDILNGKRLYVGETLRPKIILTNSISQEELNVTIKYIIKDFSGNIYMEQTEVVSILERKEFIKEISTESLEIGSYILGIDVLYGEEFATSSAPFEIIALEKEKTTKITAIIAIITLTIIIGIILIKTILKEGKIKNKLRKR